MLSKILEKAAYVQLFSHLTMYNLISPNQFGFKSRSFTINACAHFTDQVLLSSMDSCSVTGVAFLNLTKAFDSVNHTILLRKLSSLLVDDTVRDWLTLFKDRSHVTLQQCNVWARFCLNWCRSGIHLGATLVRDLHDWPTWCSHLLLCYMVC